MLIRPGRVFGVTVSPNSTTASGVWSLRDMLSSRSTSSWPMPGLITPDTPVASRCEGSYLAASWSSYTGGSVASYTLEWRSRPNGSSTYSSSTSVPMSTSPKTGITLMSLDTYYSVRVQASLTDASSSPWSNWSNEVKRFSDVVVPAPTLVKQSALVVRATSASSMNASEDYSLVSIDLELYASSDGVTYGLENATVSATPGAFLTTPPDSPYYRARQRFNYQLNGCGSTVVTSSWSTYSNLTV